MKVEIKPDELLERNADNRGRITLGSEYADESVKLLVLKGE